LVDLAIGTVSGTKAGFAPTTHVAAIAATARSADEFHSVVPVLLFAIEETLGTNNAIRVLLAVHASECDAAFAPGCLANNVGGFRERKSVEVTRSEQIKEQCLPRGIVLQLTPQRL
jgi:hypothetical protein